MGGSTGGVMPCHGDCALQEILYPTLIFHISRCLAEGRAAPCGRGMARVRCQMGLHRPDVSKKKKSYHRPQGRVLVGHVQVAMALVSGVGTPVSMALHSPFLSTLGADDADPRGAYRWS